MDPHSSDGQAAVVVAEPPAAVPVAGLRRNWRNLVVRIALTAAALVVWFWTQSLIGARSLPASGIGDGLLSVTSPLNQYLRAHPSGANALLIVSSAFIDLMAIFLLGSWIFAARLRPFLALVIVLGLRQTMQALVALPTPPESIWHYPGFPSLLVTYNVGNDYFFSGHTAIAVLAAVELARFRRAWVTAAGVIVLVFEILAVLALRAQYTMDVFTGILAALLSVWLAERIARRLEPATSS